MVDRDAQWSIVPEAHQFAVVVSEFAELEHRWKAAAATLENQR